MVWAGRNALQDDLHEPELLAAVDSNSIRLVTNHSVEAATDSSVVNPELLSALWKAAQMVRGLPTTAEDFL